MPRIDTIEMDKLTNSREFKSHSRYPEITAEILSLPNSTDGLNVSRVNSFSEEFLLRQVPLFFCTHETINQVENLLKEVFTNTPKEGIIQNSIYLPLLDLAIITRDPIMERNNGFVVSEAQAAHERFHGSSSMHLSRFYDDWNLSFGYSWTHSKTQEGSRGFFYEEGMASVVESKYNLKYSTNIPSIVEVEEANATLTRLHKTPINFPREYYYYTGESAELGCNAYIYPANILAQFIDLEIITYSQLMAARYDEDAWDIIRDNLDSLATGIADRLWEIEQCDQLLNGYKDTQRLLNEYLFSL